jgi:hypothetical protein
MSLALQDNASRNSYLTLANKYAIGRGERIRDLPIMHTSFSFNMAA